MPWKIMTYCKSRQYKTTSAIIVWAQLAVCSWVCVCARMCVYENQIFKKDLKEIHQMLVLSRTDYGIFIFFIIIFSPSFL